MPLLPPIHSRYLVLAALLLAPSAGAQEERPPAVAGTFYPAAPAALGAELDRLLQAAPTPRGLAPVAIVVPHAGYVFSGAVAALAFHEAELQKPEVVVILGTNHTVPGFTGVGLSPASAFRTPLGAVPVDRGLTEQLRAACPDCRLDATVHAAEHSVEVEVPFVQRLWPQARIVAAVVGEPDLDLCRRFGTALAGVLRGRRALVVASSDLSHYPTGADASRVDARTLDALTRFDPPAVQTALRASMSQGTRNLVTGACGEAPVLVAMYAARALGATRGVLLRYTHSGEVSGDNSRVVGYGAVAFVGPGRAAAPAGTPSSRRVRTAASPRVVPARLETGLGPVPDLSPQEGATLVAIARKAIAARLEGGPTPALGPLSPRLTRVQGAFVTLREHGDLRGCIGRIVGDRPLAEVVADVAVSAAFEDPRFPPLRRDELTQVEIEVSVLTPVQPVSGPGAIVPGRDGVVLEKGGRSAVFLPQVATEMNWGRDQMLDNLCQKASLPTGCWRAEVTLHTFRAQVVQEEGRGQPQK